MDKQEQITPDMLRDLLAYDPETGLFMWASRPDEKTQHLVGKPCFRSKNNRGYHQGGILGRKFTAHRVAWAIHYGSWPVGEIDHINGDRGDNRIANLRDVTPQENRRNMRPRASKSGIMGVYWYPITNRWTAHITNKRRHINLGYFLSLDDAIAARKAAEAKFGFHPNHGMVMEPSSK
jgi:hypothetical protein